MEVSAHFPVQQSPSLGLSLPQEVRSNSSPGSKGVARCRLKPRVRTNSPGAPLRWRPVHPELFPGELGHTWDIPQGPLAHQGGSHCRARTPLQLCMGPVAPVAQPLVPWSFDERKMKPPSRQGLFASSRDCEDCSIPRPKAPKGFANLLLAQSHSASDGYG